MTDGSSDSGSENGITGDPEPYRFFGLRLEKCDFGGVRLGIDEVLQLEKHKILPDEYIEKIKSEVKRDALISALKLALSHLAKYYCKRPLKEGCLEVLFGKPGSLGCQSCLRKGEYFLISISILRERIGGLQYSQHYAQLLCYKTFGWFL